MLSNMIQMIILLFVSIILPFVLGCLWTYPMKRYHHSIFMAIVTGWITMFMIAQFLAVPMIVFTTLKFHVLLIFWVVCVLAVSIFSAFKNRRYIREMAEIKAGSLAEIMKDRCYFALLLAAAAMVLFQAAGMAFINYDHLDDVRYVPTAVDAYFTDTMLEIEPVSGRYIGKPEGEMWKDAVAPINIFWAMLSKIIQVHPAITMHFVVPFIFIIIGYMIYTIMGERLMRGDKKRLILYMVILNVVILYGYYGFHGNLIPALLHSIWWGKSMQAALILPFIFTLMLLIMDEEENKIYYPLLFCTMWADALMTTMAAIIPTVMVGVYGVVHALMKRKPGPLIKALICCLPCLCYGILYYLVRHL